VNRLGTVLLAGLIAACLSGCVLFDRTGCSSSLEALTAHGDLKDIFNGLAGELCEGACGPVAEGVKKECAGRTVLVTDFVDVQSYTPKKAGAFLGELMRSSLSGACRYKIVQAEFSEYFKLTDQGLTALTRNPKEIKNAEFPYSEAVVGTYQFNADKVYLFARRLNIHTGKISKMASREITLPCNGLATFPSP
jgi:hypothetical protein